MSEIGAGSPSAQEIIETLLEKQEDPALERVLRDARGQPAAPRPLDHVATMAATDGEVALDIPIPFRDCVTIRHAGESDRALPGEYEIAVADGGLTLVAGLTYPECADVVREFGSTVVLETDRRHLYREDAATKDATQGEIWAILFH